MEPIAETYEPSDGDAYDFTYALEGVIAPCFCLRPGREDQDARDILARILVLLRVDRLRFLAGLS